MDTKVQISPRIALLLHRKDQSEPDVRAALQDFMDNSDLNRVEVRTAA